MRRKLGYIVLIAFLVGYLGILLIGQPGWFLAVPAFLFTFAVGFFDRFRHPPGRVRLAPPADDRAAWIRGALIAGTAVTILATVLTLALLSGGRGTPDISDAGLLMPRPSYTLSNKGGPSVVERWRYLAVGLLFYTFWFSGSGAVAVLVFFKTYPPTLWRDDA